MMLAVRESDQWRRARSMWLAALERTPALWCHYMRRRHPSWPIVHPGTDLVIEGCPGSGNSFAREAVRLLNPAAEIASHCHSPAHVLEALRLGKPAVVIVRPPLEAIGSEVARFDQADPVRELIRYERFHRRLLPHARRVVVATFDRVTSSFGDVIEEVNRRVGTTFVPLAEGDRGAVEQIFDVLVEYNRSLGIEAGRAAVPGRDREQRARAVADRLRGRRDARRLGRCEALYAQFAAIERSNLGERH